MDYEFRILAAERELAHLRAMKDLQAQRLDVQDHWLTEMQRVIGEIAATTQRTSNNLELLGVKVDLLATKIDKLVDGMLKPAKNGGN
jgi:hypothetical protein